jgi:hypothetical protein
MWPEDDVREDLVRLYRLQEVRLVLLFRDDDGAG